MKVFLFDFGSLSEWLSAIGTISACVIAIFANFKRPKVVFRQKILRNEKKEMQDMQIAISNLGNKSAFFKIKDCQYKIKQEWQDYKIISVDSFMVTPYQKDEPLCIQRSVFPEFTRIPPKGSENWEELKIVYEAKRRHFEWFPYFKNKAVLRFTRKNGYIEIIN